MPAKIMEPITFDVGKSAFQCPTQGRANEKSAPIPQAFHDVARHNEKKMESRLRHGSFDDALREDMDG
jgi:FlaG/FlaF family flagellin (archaellin)